jgi:uncharacterized protein (DUF169 family)
MAGGGRRGFREFFDALGLDEEPMGMWYTDVEPEKGFAPEPLPLPDTEKEAGNAVDWQALWSEWSCVLGHIWRARKKRTTAYFDAEHFGCLGGAFFLGYLKPQLELIVHYVSTGIPGVVEGERYLDSPEMTRKFYEYIDPRPAPKRFCVFRPLPQYGAGEEPELVTFFARPEVISGLHQLATFVTNDFHVVQSPWGSGCSDIVTWPLKYLRAGQLKAVVGGWDPSCRRYLKTDEITFTVPRELYERMLERWPESFLATKAWQTVKKKIIRSGKAWGEKE